jgi:hypothetical protein
MFPNGIPVYSIHTILLWVFTACLCTLSGDWTDLNVPALPVDPHLQTPGRGFPEDFCY